MDGQTDRQTDQPAEHIIHVLLVSSKLSGECTYVTGSGKAGLISRDSRFDFVTKSAKLHE